MSASYAKRLSDYPNKGVCGLPEQHESQRSLAVKLDTLAQLILKSEYTVVLTGAGISTAAGIPDFRGPNGIWTKEQEEKKRQKRQKKRQEQPCRVDRHCEKRMQHEQPTHSSSSSQAVERHHVSYSDRRGTETSHKRRHEMEEPYQQLHKQLTTGSGYLCEQNVRNRDSTNTEKLHSTECNNHTLMSNDPPQKTFQSFASAIPTYTHWALTHLLLKLPQQSSDNESNYPRTIKRNAKRKQLATDPLLPKRMPYLRHIITQNVDSLHRKTHLPRKYQSILHGDIFTEICDKCHTEHIRSYEISSIGRQYTGQTCTLGGSPPGSCGGKLRDTLLDWEDDLPEKDWETAQKECQKAQLILCLGTSLNIEPAASLCMLAKEEDDQSGKLTTGTKKASNKQTNNKKSKQKLGFVIVNLQKTPYDDEAELVIHGRVDIVMEGLMKRLGFPMDWYTVRNNDMKNDDHGKIGSSGSMSVASESENGNSSRAVSPECL